jgi:hypothetical protein
MRRSISSCSTLLPGKNVFEVGREVRAFGLDTPNIFLSALRDSGRYAGRLELPALIEDPRVRSRSREGRDYHLSCVRRTV